jgi:hypothetical protein
MLRRGTHKPSKAGQASRSCGHAASLRQLALVYRDPGEYTGVASGFLWPCLAADARGLVIVPSERHARLRTALGHGGAGLAFADMTSLGVNPAQIIPAIEAFTTADGVPARVVTEPIWPGRAMAEVREATKREALINLAFAGRAVQILCAYDAASLPRAVLADTHRTHPQVTGSDAPQARRHPRRAEVAA